MTAGLSIRVVEVDPDYLGVEIRGWTNRYCGTTFVYAAPGELAGAAGSLQRFPASQQDERIVGIGSRDAKMASGYCGLRLRSGDPIGHATLEVEMLECDLRFSPASVSFEFAVEPGLIDQFASQLASLEMTASGEATLELSG